MKKEEESDAHNKHVVRLGSLLEDEPFSVRAVHGTGGSGWYVHDRRLGSRRTVSTHPGQALNRHQVDELYTLALGEGLAALPSGGGWLPFTLVVTAVRALPAALASEAAALPSLS